MNVIVTQEMFAIMRTALGLGVFQKRPATNRVIMCTGTNADLVEQMIDMELLSRKEYAGMRGREYNIMVTDEGIRLTMDEQKRYHELADQVTAEHKAQHEKDFRLSKKHPYVPNGWRIHEEVLRRMVEIEAE